MAKVKEQVKYNPKWSDVKRINRARMDISGKANTVLTIVFLLFSLLMAGVNIVGAIIDKDFFYEGFQSVASIAFGGMFMLFFVFALNCTLPLGKMVRRTEVKQKAMLGGCVNIYETFCFMPVQKVTLFKQSFMYYAIMLFMQIIPSIVLNVIIMIRPELHFAGGMVTIVTVTAVIFTIAMYSIVFGAFKSDSELVNKMYTVFLAVFYIFWMGCIFGFFDDFVMAEPLCALAGIPCICLAVLAVIAVIAIEKLYVEKREINAAWSFKEVKHD